MSDATTTPTTSHDKPRQGGDTEPRQAATGGVNSDDRATTGAVSVAAVTPPQTLTVEEAAAMLDVSARTIQRRCQSGKLSAKQVEGEFGEVWEIARATVEQMAATKSGDKRRQGPRQSGDRAATSDDKEPRQAATSGVSVAAIDAAQNNDERPQVADRDEAAPDFRARYIAQMEAENSFLKSQLEDANRNAAELRAALRKALEIAPRQLTPGTPTDATAPTASAAPEMAQGAPLDSVTTETATVMPGAVKSPQNAKSAHSQKEPRPLWKVILGVR